MASRYAIRRTNARNAWKLPIKESIDRDSNFVEQNQSFANSQTKLHVASDKLDRRPTTAASVRKILPVQSIDLIGTLTDSLSIVLAGSAATFVLQFTDQLMTAEMLGNIVFLIVLGAFFHTLASRYCGCLDADARFSYKRSLPRTLRAWAGTVLFLMTMTILLRARVTAPAIWMSAWFIIGCVLLSFSRVALVASGRHARAMGYFDRRSAIIGTGPLAISLAEYLAGHEWLTISIAGVYADSSDTAVDRLTSPSFKGYLHDLISDIRLGRIDQVFVALPPLETERISAVMELLKLTPVRVRCAFDPLQPSSTNYPRVMLGDIPLITASDRPLIGFDRIAKSLADRTVGLIALVAFAPLLAVIALAIRIEGGGPILFRQMREGFNCHPFSIWKFRTMRWDACNASDIVQACQQDPRVTRLGAFLRRTSLDELPQLFNVVAGQMSLIGPRPHVASTRAGSTSFTEVATDYPARHRVKPGITGWAQVCGLRGQTDTEEKLIKRLRHDLYYIENWSILFDMYILLRTVAVIPFQRTAY